MNFIVLLPILYDILARVLSHNDLSYASETWLNWFPYQNVRYENSATVTAFRPRPFNVVLLVYIYLWVNILLQYNYKKFMLLLRWLDLYDTMMHLQTPRLYNDMSFSVYYWFKYKNSNFVVTYYMSSSLCTFCCTWLKM